MIGRGPDGISLRRTPGRRTFTTHLTTGARDIIRMDPDPMRRVPAKGGTTLVSSAPKLLVVLAALSFVVAVVVSLTDPILGLPAESFSRACTNLALLAIAVAVMDGKAAGG